MERVWWEQAGPRSFCEDILYHLERRSVAACFPQFSHEDTLHWLDQKLVSISHYVDAAAANGLDPATFLQVERAGGSETDELPSVPARKTGVIVVKNLLASTWPSWCDYVLAYHRSLKVENRREAARFLLICRGISEEKLRPDGVDLKVVLYKGRIRLHDMEEYCASVLQSGPLAAETDRSEAAEIEKRVKAAVIAQLALGDWPLAEWLCGKRLDTLLNPMNCLQEYAAQRGVNTRTKVCWEAGTLDRIAGKEEASSLVLAVNREQTALAARLWKGQLRVLFPYLEERRWDFIDLICEHFRFPKGINFADKEFREIAVVIRSSVSHDAAQNYLQIADYFREARNDLAHRRPVPADLLECMLDASQMLNDLRARGPVRSFRVGA